jgi:hypothetical protein
MESAPDPIDFANSFEVLELRSADIGYLLGGFRHLGVKYKM